MQRTKNISFALNKYIKQTPLEKNIFLSDKYNANIYFKREDLQLCRSFKIRGALHKILKYRNCENLVTASAGNHAQGVAYACNLLDRKGTIFLPTTTPLQKINRIKYYGKDKVKVKIIGNNFNESLDKAIQYSELNTKNIFIHPYDDIDVIYGQSTIAHEIYNEIKPDYIVCSVGGGGLMSGLTNYVNLQNNNNDIRYNTDYTQSTYFSNLKKHKVINDYIYNKNKKHYCEIVGVEPDGATSLKESLKQKKRVILKNIDTFVDGASVSQIGKLNYNILKNSKCDPISVTNEHLSHELLNIYQREGIVLEPAGGLPICALDKMKNEIKGKTVVCVLSGGNNDVTRYNEIMELNLNYLQLKHYFIMDFVQKPNQLKLFINNILTETDDITRFEYIKKANKNYGRVLIGIELGNKDNLKSILSNLHEFNYKYTKIEVGDQLYDFVV